MTKLKTVVKQSSGWVKKNALFLGIVFLPTLSRAASGDISQVTDGLKMVLNIISLIGFILGVILIIGGAAKMSGGETDVAKKNLIGGLLMAAASTIMLAFFNLFDNQEVSKLVE